MAYMPARLFYPVSTVFVTLLLLKVFQVPGNATKQVRMNLVPQFIIIILMVNNFISAVAISIDKMAEKKERAQLIKTIRTIPDNKIIWLDMIAMSTFGNTTPCTFQDDINRANLFTDAYMYMYLDDYRNCFYNKFGVHNYADLINKITEADGCYFIGREVALSIRMEVLSKAHNMRFKVIRLNNESLVNNQFFYFPQEINLYHVTKVL